MTHLNFSVEQHGGIYILLSGNVSTFFSSANIEKDAHTHVYTHTQQMWAIVEPGHSRRLCSFISTVVSGVPKMRRNWTWALRDHH